MSDATNNGARSQNRHRTVGEQRRTVVSLAEALEREFKNVQGRMVELVGDFVREWPHAEVRPLAIKNRMALTSP